MSATVTDDRLEVVLSMLTELLAEARRQCRKIEDATERVISMLGEELCPDDWDAEAAPGLLRIARSAPTALQFARPLTQGEREAIAAAPWGQREAPPDDEDDPEDDLEDDDE